MYHPGNGIRLRGSGRTHTGQVRDNNEDSIHLWTHQEHVALAVVADGMGGAVAGEEASRIAVETIQSGLTNAISMPPDDYNTMPETDLVKELTFAIQQANLNIYEQAIEIPELKGMGTTVTLAIIRNTHIVVGHVGDSRAYLVNGYTGDISQITNDHSFVQALVDGGHITAEEAEDHPMGNVLYRALGQARDVEVDVYYETLGNQDRIVLCSDGLTAHVKSREIGEIALKHDDPDLISQELVELANKRGGRDNVSVIVIIVEKDGDASTENHRSAEVDDPSATRPTRPDALGEAIQRDQIKRATQETHMVDFSAQDTRTSGISGEGHDPSKAQQ